MTVAYLCSYGNKQTPTWRIISSFPMSTSRKLLLMAESNSFVPQKNFTGRALSPRCTKTVFSLSVDIWNKHGHPTQALGSAKHEAEFAYLRNRLRAHVMVKPPTPRGGNGHQFDSKPFPVHVVVGHTIDRCIRSLPSQLEKFLRGTEKCVCW